MDIKNSMLCDLQLVSYKKKKEKIVNKRKVSSVLEVRLHKSFDNFKI